MSMVMWLADASSIIAGSAGSACGTSCGNPDINKTFQGIANTLIFIVGSISVIMIIIGGLRYVISNGDQKSVEGAKNTILYAVIGIIMAIAAFAIVTFVTKYIK
jgi:TRAP-type C4-dicarboxylate transport system permease small subunit